MKSSLAGIALAAVLGACAHHNNAQSANSAQNGTGVSDQTAMNATACPLAQMPVPVHVTVADVSKGVAVTFVAPTGNAEALRDDVRSMADANDKQGDAFAACPCAQGTKNATGAAEAMPTETMPAGNVGDATPTSMASMPQASARMDETPGGAVLVLTAKADPDVGALRIAVRQHVHAMRHACLNQNSQTNQPRQPDQGSMDDQNR